MCTRNMAQTSLRFWYEGTLMTEDVQYFIRQGVTHRQLMTAQELEVIVVNKHIPISTQSYKG